MSTMDIAEAAAAFRDMYTEASGSIAAAAAVKVSLSKMPEADAMTTAVRAVIDCDAEPKHYAWFVAKVLGVPAFDGDPEPLVSPANLTSPKAFTARAAGCFKFWYANEVARVKMAVSVAEADKVRRLSKGADPLTWYRLDCQEPVYRAEGLLRLLGPKWSDKAEDARMVRQGLAKAMSAPGYDLKAFPLVVKASRGGWENEIRAPAWARPAKGGRRK